MFTIAPILAQEKNNGRMDAVYVPAQCIIMTFYILLHSYPVTAREMNRTHLPSTRRKAIHGGSTPASMRVMVVDKCVRFILELV